MTDGAMTKLRATVEARYQLAKEAAHWAAHWAPPPWRYRALNFRHDAIVSGLGGNVLTFAHHYEPVVAVVDFIEANDPGVVIRQCARDLKVLERHRRMTWATFEYLPESLEALRHKPFCSVCRVDEWPCADLRDLAEAYGLSLGEG